MSSAVKIRQLQARIAELEQSLEAAKLERYRARTVELESALRYSTATLIGIHHALMESGRFNVLSETIGNVIDEGRKALKDTPRENTPKEENGNG